MTEKDDAVATSTDKKIISHKSKGTMWRKIHHNIVPILLLLCLAVPQATCFITNIGPWTMPDYDMHVPATYALATGQIAPEMTPQSKDEFDNTVQHPIISGDSRYLANEGTRNDLISNIIQDPFHDPSVAKQRTAANGESRHIRNANRATQYAPVGYIPQAMGLRLGMLLFPNPYEAMQLARVFNFIACLSLYIASIILLPRAKTLMAIIASIPTVCFVSSSIMADGLTVALAALLTALALRTAILDTTMRTSTLIAVTIVSAMICYIKVLYLVPLLIVLVSPDHILSIKRKIYMSLALAVVFISYMLWRHQFSTTAYLANHQNNLSYMIHHPLNTISVITINMVTGWGKLIPANSFIVVIVILLITITISPFLNNHNLMKHTEATFIAFILRYRYLIVVILGAILAWALTYGFMALTWNDLSAVGAHGPLEGVQGRHALPLLPLLAVTSLYAQKTK